MAQQEMILERLPNATQIFPFGKEISRKMTAEDRIQPEDQPIDHEDPGKEQMPLPSHGQPFPAWKRGPGRKPADRVV